MHVCMFGCGWVVGVNPDLAMLLQAQRLTVATPPPAAAALLPNLLWARLLKGVGQARGTLPVVCDLIRVLVASNAASVNVLVYNACLGALKAQTAVAVGLDLVSSLPRNPSHSQHPGNGGLAETETDAALWAAVTATMRALQASLPGMAPAPRVHVTTVVREVQAGRDTRRPAMAPAVQLAWGLVGLLLACGHTPSAGSVNSAAEVALVAGDVVSACRLLQLAHRLAVPPTAHTVRVAERARQMATHAGLGNANAVDAAVVADLLQCERQLRAAVEVAEAGDSGAVDTAHPGTSTIPRPAVAAAAVYEPPSLWARLWAAWEAPPTWAFA
jgi:hypothetical protein